MDNNVVSVDVMTGRAAGEDNPALLTGREWLAIQRREWEEFKIEARKRDEEKRKMRKLEAERRREERRQEKIRLRAERKAARKGGGGR